MTLQTFAIRRVQAFCYRYPLSTPVVTSFGRMLNRPAVFVRVEDEDGQVGWGEVWANFPSTGAEHRARLVNEVLAPTLSEFAANEPSDVFDTLTKGTSVLALQSGEFGPFAQAIAGIDLAVWDLYARRRNMALWKMLGGNRNQIRVYASGINPTDSRQMAEAALSRGHRALKLKIGFDLAADRANLASLHQLIGDGMLAADANQAWSTERALEIAPHLAEFGLAWLEEPIRADRPWQEWQRLREGAGLPLAAGENITSRAGFEQALGDDVLRVVQPDIAKWGGLSICSDICARYPEIGQDFLPALSRRRDRLAGIGAFAGGGRGRRIAGSGCQRQPVTRPLLRSRRRYQGWHGDAG